MKCPHCGISHHDYSSNGYFSWRQTPTEWNYEVDRCPNCEKLTISINEDNKPSRVVEPLASARHPIPASVPADIARDYLEACLVLPISSKASAALSRRCLQIILNNFGYKAKDLAKQVDAVLNEQDPKRALSISLYNTVDAIRNFGNFSAHPIDEKTSLQIIEVEPEEAEWCLEILEEMFEHFYERPALAAAKKAALDAKLAAAGKPPSK
jgi:hypothetical protein